MIQLRFSSGIAAVVGAMLLCVGQGAAARGYVAAPPKGVDLSGNWRVNAAKSDDAERLLQKRLDELRKERDRYLRDARRTDPLGIPPLGLPPLPPTEEGAKPPSAPGQPRRPRTNDNLRRMLNISDTLVVTQKGATIDITSELDARRFQAGSNSQVSMPTGELADSRVGWDGEWFVIERKARKGPNVTEKYRWLKKTDQLESQIKWGGDTLLSGIKVHRIYDRMQHALPAPNPEAGPVR